MSDHAQPASLWQDKYVKIWALLLALLIVSVAGPEIAKFLPQGLGKLLTLFTAFGIAIVKAYMVVKYFMHIGVEKKYVGYLLVTMLALMLVYFAGVSPDVLKHEGLRWRNDAAHKVVNDAQKAAPSPH
jgi:caa(3)-type oxidase subunit IV